MWAQMLATLAIVGATTGPAATPKIPTLADPVRGLALWRGAKVGMSAAQVQALFPAAAAPAHPIILTGGEVDRLQLSGVDLDGHPALGRFFFKDAELVSVELALTDLKPEAPAYNVAVAKRISVDLSIRYGRGYDCGDRSFGDIDAYECKWLSKPLSIRLWYMDTAGQAPLFYLAYRQADDPGYNL